MNGQWGSRFDISQHPLSTPSGNLRKKVSDRKKAVQSAGELAGITEGGEGWKWNWSETGGTEEKILLKLMTLTHKR